MRPPVARLIGALTRHRVRNYDLVFDTSDPAIAPKLEAQLFWRLYESAEIRMVRQHLGRTGALVDLGASLGFTGSHAFRHIESEGQFVAVEGNSALLKPLERTLRQHASGQQINVVHAAIDYSGQSTVPMDLSGESVDSRVTSVASETTSMVSVTTLSRLLDRFDIDRFTLLSDIEGAEADIIFSDATALSRCEQAVIELHQTPRYTVDELHVELERQGFETRCRYGPVVALGRPSMAN